MKIRDKLLEIFDSEDKWVQQVSYMVNKNDQRELADRLALLDDSQKNNRTLDHIFYDPNKITCWCLSGALENITRRGLGKPYQFILEFNEKYGDIDKFNDSHSFEEVIEAIKSIDA